MQQLENLSSDPSRRKTGSMNTPYRHYWKERGGEREGKDGQKWERVWKGR